MADINFDHHAQFFTVTILKWHCLLEDNKFKDVIVSSLQFLKERGYIEVYAFVIMPNHIHLIWQIQDGYLLSSIQQRFLKFTAQKMKYILLDSEDPKLDFFKVNAKDRLHQFWERNPLSVDLWSPAVFEQKLDYIHNNPLQDKWQLATETKDYHYSSANFYESGLDHFNLLTHHRGI
ncbi:transposase [Mucilaginibacter ginkgonis]|uniref:Transposase n=1 Tax=Mucilaginibacter ginkgonis TaxID=2682091 RepID=A0A7T7JFF8_9SPHI|nr:transposase [Mucilaginibacter ginkgonis]QQL48417.1 transposase [Mucilaginibacter ginkgonis]